MKTILPKRSQNHQEIIEQITNIIKEQGKSKIAYVILFGSFAKGTWVDDARTEKDGTNTFYNSDYDFLVLTSKHNDGQGRKASDLERKIKQQIERKYLDRHRVVSIIVESLNRVNNDLSKGHYFFSDIKKEGILLYKADKAVELKEPKELTNVERKEMAQDDYDVWFKKGDDFLKDSNYALVNNRNNNSAFYLHQATEALFNCIELVFTNYKPKIHDIEQLNRRCLPFCKELENIFPKNTQTEKDCFELLKLAYVDARYDKNYSITKEQLKYLITRVEKLKEVATQACLKKIESFK